MAEDDSSFLQIQSQMAHDLLTPKGWCRKDAVAVLGSARMYTSRQVGDAFRVGREIGARGCLLVTGATSGLPYAAALGAKSRGAFVIGISPAGSLEEHQRLYQKPTKQADFIVFTGMGLDGRSPLILRSCRAAIFIGGELGTLGEFCSGWMCGNKVLGILRGRGGIADSIELLLESVNTTWGSKVIFGEDPEDLVKSVCAGLPPTVSTEEEPGEDVRSIIQSVDSEGSLL